MSDLAQRKCHLCSDFFALFDSLVQVYLGLVEELRRLLALHLQLDFLLYVRGHNCIELQRKITQIDCLVRVDNESALCLGLARAILDS